MSEFQSTVPATRAAAVTPNDGANLPHNARSLYVGTAGNVHLETIEGDDVTMPVGDNQYLLQQVQKVFSTGTTASNIFAVW